MWIIRDPVFRTTLSNFLFAAQTSNCFGCFCHPATSAHNNPHCPQQAPPPLLFVFDTVLLQIVLAPPLNSFVSAHSLINVFRWGLNCFVDITQSFQVEGGMVNLAAIFFCPANSSPSGYFVKPRSAEVEENKICDSGWSEGWVDFQAHWLPSRLMAWPSFQSNAAIINLLPTYFGWLPSMMPGLQLSKYLNYK